MEPSQNTTPGMNNPRAPSGALTTQNPRSSAMQGPAEGKIAKAIEEETAKIPSDTYLWAAGAALVGSAVAQFLGKSSAGRAPMATFIGLWVPSLLLLGVYNKIVKVAGSDRKQQA